MNESATDRRRHSRHQIPLQAALLVAGVVVSCRVHNISASGALIEANAQSRVGDRATVIIPEFGHMVGRVDRVSSTTVGIAFDDGGEATNAFIVEWLALEAGNAERPETAPADQGDRQAV